MFDVRQETSDGTVVRASETDWAAIAELLGECDLPQDGLRPHLATTLVARIEGAVAGLAAIEPASDGTGVLRSVAVTPRSRGLGLGMMLTREALSLARGRGLRDIFLLTNGADQFFARAGFVVIGRDEVPAAVRTSTEFVLDCCRSATVMRLRLEEGGGVGTAGEGSA